MKGTALARRSSIGAITLNVALIHAAGLVLLNQSGPDAASRGGGAARPQAVQMRLAKAVHATQPTPNAATSQPEEAPTPEVAAMPDPSATPDQQVPEAQTEEAPAVDNIAAGPGIGPDSDTTDSGSEYLPRPRLSEAPRPATPVMVPFPAEITERGRYTTILALFIDENGVVRRVRIDGPALPKPFEEAARETFLQAHFTPGRVRGQQVKSLIRVEVVFDNLPIEGGIDSTSL